MKEEQKRHIFLTGEKQVGKSTIIRRFLEVTGLLPEKLGGFRSENRPESDDRLSVYLVSPAGTEELNRENRIMIRSPGIREQRYHPEIFPEVFENKGVELLRSDGSESLILMDELGFAEEEAPSFQKAVLETLDGPVPVLGVLRQGPGEFLNQVASHPLVSVIRVTEENREEITALMRFFWNLRKKPVGVRQ